MLFFFEAAYRTGSFTACAAELNVTQAAVSKRIRQFEVWIGDPLFARSGKRLLPTSTADRLYQTSNMALEFLQQGIASLREEARRPLSIGANTSIGMFWLTVRLREFGLSANACPTRLLTSDNAQDLLSESNDLIVVYGAGKIPGWDLLLLLEEELSPVASPKLATELGVGSIKTLGDIAPAMRPPLLNYPRSGPDWIDWRAWFEALALQGLLGWRIEPLATYSQTIGEAIQGKGIALGSLSLLGAELKAGSLICLLQQPIDEEFVDHRLIYPAEIDGEIGTVSKDVGERKDGHHAPLKAERSLRLSIKHIRKVEVLLFYQNLPGRLERLANACVRGVGESLNPTAAGSMEAEGLQNSDVESALGRIRQR